MQGYPYTLPIRGKPVRATMLAGASTQPDCRGRGLMPKVLAQFMALSAQRGEEAVFHTPASHPTFFKCLHYSPSRTAFVRAEGEPGALMPDGLRETAAEASLAEMLLPVYTRAMGRYAGIVMRTGAEMELKLSDYGSDGGRVLLCKGRDGGSSGYTAYMDDGEEGLSAQELARRLPKQSFYVAEEY